jgi:hypothetical protein
MSLTKLKGFGGRMPLFLFIFHTFIQSHLSVIICRSFSPSLHHLSAQWEKPPCGAEPRIELGPASQQADALPIEPRRTILNYAAP